MASPAFDNRASGPADSAANPFVASLAPADAATADRLTIFRMLVITAGIAVGLVVFSPEVDPNDKAPYNIDYFRALAVAPLIGACLPAGFFAFGLRRRARSQLGPGGLLALAMTCGVLLLLPPSIAENKNGMGETCLRVTLPLMSLWYLVALVAAGQLNRETLTGGLPWSERYPLYLAIAWLPEACWLLWDIYEGAFS